MLNANFDDSKFLKEMNNIIDYSNGYIEGINQGKSRFIDNIGKDAIESIKQFVDSNARVNPAALQHMYEWNETGSPAARLFDIKYISNSFGLSFDFTFRQSASIKSGSTTPFYDKARIMEQGIPVVIRPKRSSVLTFVGDDGEQVFTKNSVTVENPGGTGAQGSFENAVNLFVSQYFSQAWLRNSGILDYLKTSKDYKNNLYKGKAFGRSAGRSVGYNFITRARAGI
jgi:hypothetical protein